MQPAEVIKNPAMVELFKLHLECFLAYHKRAADKDFFYGELWKLLENSVQVGGGKGIDLVLVAPSRFFNQLLDFLTEFVLPFPKDTGGILSGPIHCMDLVRITMEVVKILLSH